MLSHNLQFLSLSLSLSLSPPPPPPPLSLSLSQPPRWPSGKVSAWRVTDLGFDPHFHRGDLSTTSHTGDLKIDSPMATMPGAWRYRDGTGTGWPGVSIPWLAETATLIGTFISVWQHKHLPEQIRPSNTLAFCWDNKQPTNYKSISLSFSVCACACVRACVRGCVCVCV